MLDHKRRVENFDRFDEDFVTAYIMERQQQNIKTKNKELSSAKPIDEFVNISNVEEFVKPERLSKRLSRLGICSRRQGEKLMAQGMIKVDGKPIRENTLVNNSNLI